MKRPRPAILMISMAILVEVAVVIASLFPTVLGVFESLVPDGQSRLTIIIGSNAMLVTGAVLVFLKQTERSNSEREQRWSADIAAVSRVEPLRAHRFYQTFMAACENAEESVMISYFAPKPPDITGHRDRQKYYRRLRTVITNKPTVSFHRLVRDTTGNQCWIRQLLREYEGRPNAFIRILKDRGDENMGLVLSTQIVDTCDVYIVATRDHEAVDRDVRVVDARLGRRMSEYYSRMWMMAVPVLEAGVITPEGERILGNNMEANNAG